MNRINPHITMPQPVAAQIAHFPDLSMAEIRALWQKLAGGGAPHRQRRPGLVTLAYHEEEWAPHGVVV